MRVRLTVTCAAKVPSAPSSVGGQPSRSGSMGAPRGSCRPASRIATAPVAWARSRSSGARGAAGRAAAAGSARRGRHARARHAGLRRAAARGADRPGRAVVGDRAAPAAAQLRGEDAHGGGFVQAIDGLAGGREARPAGRLVPLRQRHRERREGAAAVQLHDGDRIWWDRHDRGAAPHVPAVVGAFPEPFAPRRGGQALSGRARVRRRRRGRLHDASRRGSARSASSPRARRSGPA